MRDLTQAFDLWILTIRAALYEDFDFQSKEEVEIVIDYLIKKLKKEEKELVKEVSKNQ